MKKLLSLLLAALMVATLFTVPAFAAEAGAYVGDADMSGVSYNQGTASWIVNIDPSAANTTDLAATAMTSGNHTLWAKKNAAVYSIPLPTVPEGKMIGSAEFRVSSRWDTEATAIAYSYKMPGEHDMTKITIGDMQKYIPGNNLGSGQYYLAPVKTGDEYWYSTYIYRNRYDVTDYINECVAAGQTNVYIAVAHGSNVKAYSHDKEYRAKLYYTLEDVPALTAESSVPEADATGVYPIGEASVTFSNAIKSATASINDADVSASDITVSGKTVTVVYDLALSQETELVVNVTDVANQTLTHTISFTTDSKYKYYDDSDMAGVAYKNGEGSWVLTYDLDAEDKTALAAKAISASNENVGNKKMAAVYKMELPEVPEGKKLTDAEFRISAWASNMKFITHLYKMPGEAWNMDTITISDAQKIIEVAPPANGANFLVSCSSDESYFNQANSNRCKYEVTDYIRECIEAGQKYVWFAATDAGTVKAYRHNTGSTGAKLYYTLEDAPVVKDAKVVSADSQADYADAADIAPSKGQSIKAISYMANITDEDVTLNVGVAQYKGDELIALSFGPYTLSAGAKASTISFGNVTVDANADKVKAIIWDAAYNPVTKAKILDVQ